MGVWIGGAVRLQAAPADTAWTRIDHIEGRLLNKLIQREYWLTDSEAIEATRALSESRRAGYSHGIAVALTCEALIVKAQTDDFLQSEKLARESLEWFGRTDNKNGITLAYYALGFALFAQSRFDEALLNIDQAIHYAHWAGNKVGEIQLLSLKGEAYRERGDYGNAFDLLA